MKRFISGIIAVALLACGCSSQDNGSTSSAAVNQPEDQIAATVASYDLAASGKKQRFMVGLLAPNGRLIDYGQANLAFSFIGTKTTTAADGPRFKARGDFIGVAGTTPAHPPKTPEALPPSKGRGVYGADVGFDRPGFWSVRVTVDIKGMGERSAVAKFQVLGHNQIPSVGDKAPRTDTLTMKSPGPKSAIDSRAQGGAPVPDPELHQISVARSIQLHQPALVVFATPVYCISQFCGPTTDMVGQLSKRYSNKANFIHVEIWKNYQHHVINKGAAAWLYRDGDLHEPWVFLIGANGKIIARWDNVVNASEIVPYLKSLPDLKS